MRMVTLSVASQQAVRQRGLDALSGKRRGAHISFASTNLLWQLLTAKRWDLLKAMTGGGPMNLREGTRHTGRNVKAVHGDVHALLAVGILRKTRTAPSNFLSMPSMSISSSKPREDELRVRAYAPGVSDTNPAISRRHPPAEESDPGFRRRGRSSYARSRTRRPRASP